MKHKVSNLLKDLGIPASIKGYHYLREAIQITIDNNGNLPPVTKIVYPCIADMYKTTSSRVERAVRHAVEKAFLNGSEILIKDIFSYTVSAKHGKVSNAAFIATVAEYLILNAD